MTNDGVRDASEQERRDRAVPAGSDCDQARVDLRGVGADLLRRIARREARPDVHARCLRARGGVGQGRLGVLALRVEQIVEHCRRRVGEAEVALQCAPHGDRGDPVARLGGERDRLVEGGTGRERAVGRNEKYAHAPILLAAAPSCISAAAATVAEIPQQARGETLILRFRLVPLRRGP